MIDLKAGYKKWKKIHIQLNAQFVVKRLTIQIWVNYIKGKKLYELAPSVSATQSSYFSKNESTDLSAPSEGSNNHLSGYSTSSISKS